MPILFDALKSVSPVQDAEVLDGYMRYEANLEKILTPQQMEVYADYIAQTDEIRIFEEMTPAEIAALPPGLPEVAAAILADKSISMENRRVVALLSQRGEHEATPDFNRSPTNA
jgi:hypothetical protein